MGFFDELKKLTHPYDDEDEDFLDEAEEVAAPEAAPEKPRMSNPFAGFSFGGGDKAEAAPAGFAITGVFHAEPGFQHFFQFVLRYAGA